MVTRVGGSRRKTRAKLSRPLRQRGKIPLTAILQTFKDGEKVQLLANSYQQSGMFHPNYHGKFGTIVKNQGTCYHVAIMDGNKKKTLIVHPVHLKRMTK